MTRRALAIAALCAACGTGGAARAPKFAHDGVPVVTTTTEAATTTTAPPPPSTASPAVTRRTATTSKPRPVATTIKRTSTPTSSPVAGAPVVPAETPRATVGATVSFNGAGNGWAAYLNLHDANSNAIAVGAQADNGDASSGGRPVVHANRVTNGHFDHAYGSTPMAVNESHRWELRYYEHAGSAVFFRDGTALLSMPMHFVGRVFYQTEVNAKVDGDSIDATFGDVRIGGTKSDGSTVLPNGVWNTTDFDFWHLDMRQTNDPSIVQGANMRGGGVISGLNGKDWDSASPPAAAIAMITEQQ